jgi:hypothetical protein
MKVKNLSAMMKKKKEQPVWKPKHKLKVAVAAVADKVLAVVQVLVAPVVDLVVQAELVAVNVVAHRKVAAADPVAEEDRPLAPVGNLGVSTFFLQ